MHERMLNRQVMPTAAEMAACCGDNAARFSALNRWLADTFGTEQSVVFPYGNHYGWCIAHRKKRTLFCNVFPEAQAFTVMLRLTSAQCRAAYAEGSDQAKELLDHTYPCGDGGWLHDRITDDAALHEVQALLAANRADAFWSHPLEHSPRCQTAATARCFPARQVRSILVMR